MVTSTDRVTLCLIIVFQLAGFSRGSQNIVKIVRDKVEQQNLCASSVLSVFVPGIDPKSEFRAFEGSEGVRDICPFLKYSCCSQDQLSSMAANLRLSTEYNEYRIRHYYELFFLLNEIEESTFNAFLGSLTREDVDCYNAKQEKYFSTLHMNASDEGNSEVLKWLEQKKKSFFFDSKFLKERFHSFKLELIEAMERIRSINKFKNVYNGNLICNMCSPVFSKYFEQREGAFNLEIRADMCSSLIKDRIDFYYFFSKYEEVQRILNLSFCARTNSKPEKDFASLGHPDLLIWNFNAKAIEKNIEAHKECIVTSGAYSKTSRLYSQCTQFCANSFTFLSSKSLSVDKMINAKVEIWNMFQKADGDLPTDQVLDSKLKDYVDFRNKFIAHKLVKLVNGATTVEMIDSIPKVNPDALDIGAFVYNFSTDTGLSMIMSQMNPKYYVSGAFLLRLFPLLGFFFWMI